MTETLLLNAVTLITTFTRLHLSWPHLGAQRCSDDDAICRDSQGPTQQHQLRQLDPYHHDHTQNKAPSHCVDLRFQDALVNFCNLNALFKNLKNKSFDIICNVPRDDERTHWDKGRGGHEDSNAAQRCHLYIQKRRQSSWVSNETIQAMSLFDTKKMSSQDPPALPSKHLQSAEDLIITSEQSIPNWYEIKSSNIRNITSSRDAYNPAQPRQF